MTVRGYRRVSSRRQADDGLSLEVQAERIKAYALSRSYDTVVDYCDAGLSGYRKNADQRPELRRLLAEAERGDIVVVAKLDRLGRNSVELHRVYGELERRGVELVCIADGFDTSTAAGKMMRSVLSAVAEIESDNASARVKATAPARVERRRKPYGGGRRMYGRNRDYSICAAEADVICNLIVPQILAGVPENVVAKEMNFSGIKSASDGRWWPGAIGKILRRPDLVGLVQVPGDDDKLIEGDLEPIIDRETGDKVMAFLAARSARSGKGRGRRPSKPVLLRGLLTCGMCGGEMVPRWKHNRMQYVCRLRDLDGAAACCQANVDATLLDAAVYGWIASDLIDLSAMQAEIEKATRSEIAGAKAAARDADRESARMDVRLATAKRRWKDDEITTAEYREVAAEIDADMVACRNQVETLDARVEALEVEGALMDAQDWTFRYLTQLRAAIESGSGNENMEAVNVALMQAFSTFTLVDGKDMRAISGGVLPDETRVGDRVTVVTSLVATGQDDLFLEPVPLPGNPGTLSSGGRDYPVNWPSKIRLPMGNYSNDTSQKTSRRPRRTIRSSSFPPAHTFVPRTR
ncbi:MAG TPA: recombinase family protein [Gaiellaceae bacterium]|nr:recombinase family protein [Gaiellaceae bacterium]